MPSASEVFATAVAHHRAGRLAEAVELYRRLLTIDPQHATVLLHLGLALRGLRQPDEALDALRRAIAADPKIAEAHHQAGNILKSLGRHAEALPALREAARLAPMQAAIWLNLGVTCLELGARDDAIAAFEHARSLEPGRPETHNILGHALAAAGRGAEARAALGEALRLRPGYAAALSNLGRLAKSEGLLDEAVAHYRAALASAPEPGTHSNLLFALNFVAEADPAEVFAEHLRWQAVHAAPLARAHTLGGATPSLRPDAAAAARAPHLHPLPTDRRLRIGYVSPDFCHHAVAYFIEPVLAAHDRRRCEIFCYANVRSPDRFTARLRGLAEHWRDIALLDDEAAAALIRRDGLDLLIDLAGHTAHHRLLVFARRPAPVQATWIGYPNTTGLDAIDYRLTDAVSDPAGETERFHSEKLVRLPATFSVYRPDDHAPPVNALPATTPGAVTFGCFNNFAKATPRVLALWARLLGALPASRLLLKSRGLGDAAVAARIRETFAAAGLAPERISLDGRELSVPDHLTLYHGVDIALDPFPYNGTTTTCEALWMGVPVVTLAGRVHAARVGASLLTHTGLADWIAHDEDDYIRVAAAAAQDLPRLAELRRTLRERIRLSPLCDAAAFTRGLEDAFAAMIAGTA